MLVGSSLGVVSVASLLVVVAPAVIAEGDTRVEADEEMGGGACNTGGVCLGEADNVKAGGAGTASGGGDVFGFSGKDDAVGGVGRSPDVVTGAVGSFPVGTDDDDKGATFVALSSDGLACFGFGSAGIAL